MTGSVSGGCVEGAVFETALSVLASGKPQLVHYYFRTMDDLCLEVLRRRADENLARFERAVAADGSLRSLWRLASDTRGARFTTEIVALSNHRKAIRAEVARVAERFREVQLRALRAALEVEGVTEADCPPVVALLLMTGLGQVLSLEQLLGVTSGHDTALAFVDAAVTRIEHAR